VKILYLILGSNEYPYLQLKEQGLETTWLTRLSSEDKAVHLYSEKVLGSSENNRDAFLARNGANLEGERTLMGISDEKADSWTFPTFKGWDSLLHKTLSAFNHAILQSDFDFIVRTAPTSFWNPKELRKRLSRLGQGMEAVGTIRIFNDIQFIEGSNIILSRNIVKKLVSDLHVFIA